MKKRKMTEADEKAVADWIQEGVDLVKADPSRAKAILDALSEDLRPLLEES